MSTLVRFFARLTRTRALLIVAALWAAIYLPALGSLEIKGEEGRRILPAVAMLDTGEWIIPQVGGVPYFSKPPLINWLIAGAFTLTGHRDEWAARLPSVLAVLALGLTAVWTLARSLGVGGALLTALFLLTNIGLMEKGRLAEIESVYLSLYGLALLVWLGNWRREADLPPMQRPGFPWRTWTLPWLFLGLGLLTKGPLNLIYFYAVVVAVLWFSRRWRELFNWAHLAGILLMLAVFAAWAVPYFHEMNAGQAASKWYAQMAGRVEVGEKFSLSAWLLNGPRGLVNFVPWVVLLPLVWRLPNATPPSGAVEINGVPQAPPDHHATHAPDFHPSSFPSDAALARGLRWAVAVCFVAISLAPQGIPRYTLPLLVPASVWLALTFVRLLPATPAALSLVWTRAVGIGLGLTALAAPVAAHYGGGGGVRWLAAIAVVTIAAYGLRRLRPLRQFADLPVTEPPPGGVPRILPLALASAVVMALITACYAFGAIFQLHRHESVRPAGLAVQHAVPAGQLVAVLRPGFLPFLFYLRPVVYLQSTNLGYEHIHYLLVRQRDLPEATADLEEHGMIGRVLLKTRDKRVRSDEQAVWLLLGIAPASSSIL